MRILSRIFALTAAFALLLLTGCASTGRVHDKSYLRALSVDGSSVTFTFFDDDELVITAESSTLGEAKRLAELKCGKPIITGYTELVILGRCPAADTLEYLLNTWSISPSCIAVCSESGEELLRSRSAELLTGTVERAKEQGIASGCGVVMVLGKLLSDGTADVPVLTADGDAAGNKIIWASP